MTDDRSQFRTGDSVRVLPLEIVPAKFRGLAGKVIGRTSGPWPAYMVMVKFPDGQELQFFTDELALTWGSRRD